MNKLNKQRPHADLIKVWADGATIERYHHEFKDTRGNGWLVDEVPRWSKYTQYRIKEHFGVEE